MKNINPIFLKNHPSDKYFKVIKKKFFQMMYIVEFPGSTL